MNGMLERILAAKTGETSIRKKRWPIEAFYSSPWFNTKCISLKENLMKPGASGIIAEFKRKSPSAGDIRPDAVPEDVAAGYAKAGASGLSVLTDFPFFGGSTLMLERIKNAGTGIPVLRKDFIVDPYQVYESKACGADVVLLIAACLSSKSASNLASLAKQLGMEVLFEIHSAEELNMVPADADLVGVNNRNLDTLKTDPETSFLLAPMISDRFVRVSESGISSPETVRSLRSSGYRGFLIGECFMKTSDPARSCREFVGKL
jgi:indole-3-glycerol phosphate synthase